jgi:hypothetical protein
MKDTLGQRLASAIDQIGSNPTRLALKIGTTQATLSNWINDRVQVEHAKAAVLLRLCDELDVLPKWLLFGQGPRTAEQPAPSQPVKQETLKLALQLVDETLAPQGLSLSPPKRAEVVSLVYELLEEGMPEAKVLRFARAAAA